MGLSVKTRALKPSAAEIGLKYTVEFADIVRVDMMEALVLVAVFSTGSPA